MAEGSTTQRVTFVGGDGTSRLYGRLDEPAGPVVSTALFAHCFTCTHNVLAATGITRALLRHGIAVMRFDFTGLGQSEGEFANTDFSSNISDLMAAVDWLRSQRRAPSLLIGHSLGGAAMLAAAHKIPEAQAIATIAAPSEPDEVVRHLRPAVPEIEARGEAEVLLAGRPFRIRKQFLDDLAEWSQQAYVADLGRPLLVCHAPGDAVIGFGNAQKILAAAQEPKSLLSLDGADHLLSRRADSTWVGNVIAAWAARFMVSGEDAGEAGAEPAASAPPHLREVAARAPVDAVVVEEASEGKFAQHVLVRRHHLLMADEPISSGGTDLGPSPYDLLLAGLGACTAMTLRLYADRAGLPLQRVAVTLHHEKIHVEDCEGCETRDARIDHIERKIDVSGPLDREARAKLLAIAEKCPVHRTLHSQVQVTSSLAVEEEGIAGKAAVKGEENFAGGGSHRSG